MAMYIVQLQRIWRDYEAAGMTTPATAREVAEWAISKGLLQPREHDPIADLAEDLACAWREQDRIHDQGASLSRHARRANYNRGRAICLLGRHRFCAASSHRKGIWTAAPANRCRLLSVEG